MKVGIKISTAGALSLWNLEDNAQVGSATSNLSLNTWYCLELYADTTTLASTAVEARLDGTSFASGTINLAAGIKYLQFGWEEIVHDTSVFVDDIAINDSTGSFQNSWPGAGQIIHLKPNAAGDNTAWSGTFADVDEVTPDDNTSKITSNTNNQISDFKLEAPYWLSSDATINAVQVGVRFNISNTTGADPNFVVRIKASSGGTVEESSNIVTTGTTTWNTNSEAAPHNYPLTLYDLPGASTTAWTRADLATTQIGVRETLTDTHFAQVSALWLLVDYTQGTKIAIDHVRSTISTAGSLTSLTLSGFSVKGTNRKLVVGVSTYDANATNRSVTGVTYGGNALTEIAGAAIDDSTTGNYTTIWYLDNPTAGSANIVVSCGGTGATAIQFGGVSLVGAATGAPDAADEDAFDTPATSGFQNSLTTSTADDMIVGVAAFESAGAIDTSTTAQLWAQSGGAAFGHARLAPTATTYTIDYTAPSADRADLVSAAFKSASGATDVTVNPSVQSLTSSQPSPTVTPVRNVTTSPSVQTVTSSQPSPTVTGGAHISPAVQTVTSSQPSPTVSTTRNVTTSPAVQTVTASQPSPTVTPVQNVTTSPAVQSLTSSQPVPSVAISESNALSVQSLTTSQPAPTVTAIRNVTVSPSVQSLTSSQPTPSIGGNAVITPAVQSLTTSQPAPTVTGDATSSPSVQSLTTSQPSPMISAVQNVTVSPSALALTASQPTATVLLSTQRVQSLTISLPTPTITAVQNLTVSPGVLSLTASLPSLAVYSQGWTGVEDTSTPWTDITNAASIWTDVTNNATTWN